MFIIFFVNNYTPLLWLKSQCPSTFHIYTKTFYYIGLRHARYTLPGRVSNSHVHDGSPESPERDKRRGFPRPGAAEGGAGCETTD